ncbi:hypothetical protein GF391_02375 [Candidatus Uhrbacteria bacterium]|nr:hypothetical protein [Candidatus Uhrbacteria bacterium]
MAMQLVMLNVWGEKLAIGAVTAPASPPYPLCAREAGQKVQNSNLGFIAIYGREPRVNEVDYQLFAWHVPDKTDYHQAGYFRKSIPVRDLDLEDFGRRWIEELRDEKKREQNGWQHVPDAEDLPMNVALRLQIFSEHLRHLYGHDRELFDLNYTLVHDED